MGTGKTLLEVLLDVETQYTYQALRGLTKTKQVQMGLRVVNFSNGYKCCQGACLQGLG